MDRGEQLINWYLNNYRKLPWRETKDPYKIWLSEIILQQTRVEQGKAYYDSFVDRYPSVQDLANASQDEVLKLWQGLGYYSRARNLHTTAQHIAHNLKGKFPNTYNELIKLKGVGPYTAAAIASFAFGEKKAVLDGNVLRVLSRIFDEGTPINSSKGKTIFQRLADESLYNADPGNYNQAIMELGAMVCKPTNPNCENCPWVNSCLSFANTNWDERPIKIKSKPPRKRKIDYLVLETEAEVIFKKRIGEDIWKGLHDFDMVEGLEEPQPEYLKEQILQNHPEIVLEKVASSPEKEYTHLLSHQKIEARFWRWKAGGQINENSIYLRVPKDNLNSIAVPRLVHKYLEDTFSI